MKKFWKKTEGFTLVELVVVIAILGILAGVGTVGYSGYVKKANMAADQTMIRDIANAVELANYSQNIATKAGSGVVGYIALAEDSIVADDTLSTETDYLHQAMVSAFGAGYENTLGLKHNAWQPNDFNDAAGNTYAESISGSTYVSTVGMEKILGEVQTCASKFAQFLSGIWSGEQGATALSGMVGNGGSTVDSMLEGYEGDQITSEVLANATVFGIAANVDDTTATSIIDSFGDRDGGYITKATNLSLGSNNILSEVSHTYAALEALVGYMNEPSVTAVLTDLNANGLMGSHTAILSNIQTACRDARVAARRANTPKYMEYYGYVEDTNSGTYVKDTSIAKSQAQIDGEAYVGIMQSVGNMSDDYTGSLNNSTLFTSPEVVNRVNGYTGAASFGEILSGLGSDALLSKIVAGEYESSVVLTFVADGKGNLVCESYPAEVLP